MVSPTPSGRLGTKGCRVPVFVQNTHRPGDPHRTQGWVWVCLSHLHTSPPTDAQNTWHHTACPLSHTLRQAQSSLQVCICGFCLNQRLAGGTAPPSSGTPLCLGLPAATSDFPPLWTLCLVTPGKLCSPSHPWQRLRYPKLRGPSPALPHGHRPELVRVAEEWNPHSPPPCSPGARAFWAGKCEAKRTGGKTAPLSPSRRSGIYDPASRQEAAGGNAEQVREATAT